MNNVLHIWRYYGQRSQTWLYRQLSNQTNYTPHLLLKSQWTDNAHPNEFPFPPHQLHYFTDHNIIHRTLSRLTTTILTKRRDTFTSSDIRNINRLASKIDARIIHIHFGWTATQLLWKKPKAGLSDINRKTHYSLILSFYGSDVFRLSPTYKKQLIKIIKTNTQIIVTSNALKKGLIEIGGIEKNISVIPVGINIEELPSIKEISITKHRKYTKKENNPLKIFTVGRLINCKAPQKLPEIAKSLQDNGIDFQWTIAGTGPLMQQCQQTIKELKLEHCFTMLGSISFQDVKKYMLDSDILVHNAIIAPDGSREALGVTLMEAGALGLPVISCNVGGIPEVVIHKQTGILVKPNQPELMTNAIIKLATNRILCQQMSNAAMIHIRKNFDARLLAKKVENIYENN